MTFRCTACGLVVDEIPRFEEGECRADDYMHHFKEVDKVEAGPR